MKTQLVLIAFVSVLIFSCKKETAVLNGLEGKWNVSELQFSGNTQKDSIVKVTNTSLEFDGCNAGDNNTTTSGCNVYITEAGERYKLVYQVQVNKQLGNTLYVNGVGESSVVNSPAYQKILLKWSKGYDIIESGDKNLIINRKYDCVQKDGTDYCNRMKVIASK